MLRVLQIAFSVCLLVSTGALASGSARSTMSTSSVDPLQVTQTVKCKVIAINEDGTVIVRDLKTQKEQTLMVQKATKFSAEKKSNLGRRKNITVADLEVGHELKVTHRPAARQVLKVKVLASV